jgi:brefeldin A-inhibited guanine nucleotide-exchange protein
VFLFSKVIEVADANMERIKIIWSRMWDIMKQHFLEIGSSKNAALAMFAIDHLK